MILEFLMDGRESAIGAMFKIGRKRPETLEEYDNRVIAEYYENRSLRNGR